MEKTKQFFEWSCDETDVLAPHMWFDLSKGLTDAIREGCKVFCTYVSCVDEVTYCASTSASIFAYEVYYSIVFPDSVREKLTDSEWDEIYDLEYEFISYDKSHYFQYFKYKDALESGKASESWEVENDDFQFEGDFWDRAIQDVSENPDTPSIVLWSE